MSFYPFGHTTNQRERRSNCRIYNLHQNPQATHVYLKDKPDYNHYRQGYSVYNSHHHHSNHHHHSHGIRNLIPVFFLSQQRPDDYQPGLVRLNKEIESVYNHLRPSKEEHQLRETVIAQIREAVKRKWSTAKVEVFGSFKTDLYLPTSDIDLVVLDDNLQRAPFYELKEELIALNICDKEKVVVLDNASVPIIKLTDKLNSIKIDIGFNIANAQESAKLTQEFMLEFPSLPYLVVILKQFLVERELNEVYMGGISSYSLILMVISFLKHFQGMKGASRVEMSNYGHLLLNFLHHYAFEFEYMTSAVSIIGNTGFVPKLDNHNMLSIQDPLCASNDVARGSYRFFCVHKAFVEAFCRLKSRLQENIPHCRFPPRELVILSEMVKIPIVHKFCNDTSHFVDGSGDTSNSTGSLSSAESDTNSASFGDTDSDSEAPVKTGPSAGSDGGCTQKLGANASSSLISELSSTDCSSPRNLQTPSSQDASLCSERDDENSGSSVASDTAMHDRLSGIKIEDGVSVSVSPPVGVVCDANNNNSEREKEDALEHCFTDQIQRITPRAKPKRPQNNGALSRGLSLAN